jgi:hypothetical protein
MKKTLIVISVICVILFFTFGYAVYTGSQKLAKAVAGTYAGLAVAAVVMGLGWWILIALIFGALWAFGYAYETLFPPWLYAWYPRKQTVTNFSATD